MSIDIDGARISVDEEYPGDFEEFPYSIDLDSSGPTDMIVSKEKDGSIFFQLTEGNAQSTCFRLTDKQFGNLLKILDCMREDLRAWVDPDD